MSKQTVLIIALLIGLSGPSVHACSAFLYGDGNRVLGGNNEDYTAPDTFMWSEPGRDGKFGYIGFGFSYRSTEGGMNEAGLFFDAFGVEPKSVPSDPTKEPSSWNMVDRIMAECATVEDIVKLLDRYEMPYLGSLQYFFGDKTGDSVIVESGGLIRKKGPYQLVTNFRQSEVKPGETPFDDRYLIGREMLEKSDVSLDSARKVLNAMHQEGQYPTLYSSVYDLTNGLIYLYSFHNYENVHVVNVKEEVAKGEALYEIAALFPPHFATELHKRLKINADYQQKQSRIDRSVTPASMEKFLGRYEILADEVSASHPDLAPLLHGRPLSITVSRKFLFLAVQCMPLSPRLEIFPESGTRFFSLCEGHTPLTFSFTLDSGDHVTQVEITGRGRPLLARKVNENLSGVSLLPY